MSLRISDLVAAGIVEASTLKKTGGTASQFLMADGTTSTNPGWITSSGSISGNAGTATALQTARTINGVSFNGTANIAVPSLYDTNYRRITNPGGGEYITSTSSVTGAIAIVLPVGWSDTMLRVTIKIYEYTTNESFEVHAGSYSYAGGGGTWANNPYAYIIGNPTTDRRFTVRFGYDSTAGKTIIYIGEITDTWSYPQVFVTEFQGGYSGMQVGYTSGWSIGFESSAFKNVTATISNCQVGFASSSNTANSVALRDSSGNFSAGTITASLSGNATTATTWQTARTITIGATGKSVNGSANVSWSLSEIGAPATDGTGASGNWGINITGSAGTASSSTNALRIVFNDGPRDLTDRLPNTFSRTVNFDFVTKDTVGGTGNYAGVMSFTPWTGTTASTGDSSYQLAFMNESGSNGTGLPGLRIRKGIDTTWGSWYSLVHAGNVGSYTAGAVTVNSGNTSASWYPILWHSGNGVYSSSGVEIYAAGNYIRSNYINTSDNDESGITRFVIKNGDNYHRSATTTVAADTIRGAASGTWNIDIAGQVSKSVAADSAANWLYGIMGTNDFFRIRAGGAANAGWLEIATADDGTEPIYVRQYTGVFADITRTATLLNSSGNTIFPGSVTGYGGLVVGNGWNITERGSSYGQFSDWVYLPGIHGFYAAENGAHIYPNNASYGAWRIAGSRNSRNGFEFDASNGNVSLMIATSSNETGFHNNSYGWQFRWADGALRVYKNVYGGGTEATVLDSSNYTSYTLPIGGSWFGVNLPGSRWGGYAVNGGEIVFGRDIPNTSQMSILVDGCYIAGENNGFWSLPSNNDWNSRRGMYWDGTYLNFTANTPTARFQAIYADGDITGGNVYTNGGWFRNHTNNNGIYWSQTGWHLYPKDGADFYMRSGTTEATIQFLASDGTGKNYLHNSTNNNIGFLSTSRNWIFRVDNSGNAFAEGDVTAYSDIRKKENIVTIDNALEKVLSIRGVLYNRKHSSVRQVGVIAQEVLSVLPEAVLEDSEGMYSVAYGNMVGLLIEAVKEQQKQIQELKSKLS